MVQRTKQTDREMAKDYSEMDYGEFSHMYDPFLIPEIVCGEPETCIPVRAIEPKEGVGTVTVQGIPNKCDHTWIDWSYNFHIRSKKCTQCEWVTDYKPNEPWLKTVKQA